MLAYLTFITFLYYGMLTGTTYNQELVTQVVTEALPAAVRSTMLVTH